MYVQGKTYCLCIWIEAGLFMKYLALGSKNVWRELEGIAPF